MGGGGVREELIESLPGDGGREGLVEALLGDALVKGLLGDVTLALAELLGDVGHHKPWINLRPATLKKFTVVASLDILFSVTIRSKICSILCFLIRYLKN